MAMKPFEIQSTSLSIGGVTIDTSAQGKLVLPGVTRATTSIAIEVEDTGDQSRSWTMTPTVIDGYHFAVLHGDVQAQNGWTPATYQVDQLDGDGFIDGITVSNGGSGYSGNVTTYAQTMFATAPVTVYLGSVGQTGTISLGTSYGFGAELHSYNLVGSFVVINGNVTTITVTDQDNSLNNNYQTGLMFSDTFEVTVDDWGFVAAGFNPIETFSANDWYEIPYRVRCGAGEIESEFGAGGSSSLSGLSDIDLSDPTNGQTIIYNGEVWTNQDAVTKQYVDSAIASLSAGSSYKGFKASYGMMVDNNSDPNGPINKLVIYQDTVSPTNYISSNTDDDTFTVTGLTGSSIVVILVAIGQNITATPTADLKTFVESVIDNVILDGGVEGQFNDIDTMKTKFYDNFSTISSTLPDLKTNFDFFSVNNQFPVDTGATIGGTGSGFGVFSITYNMNNDTLDLGSWSNGQGYVEGDIITIAGDKIHDQNGNYLSTPANDITITVTGVNGGWINTYTVTGSLPRPAVVWPGDCIQDGGSDEYDNGNYINTDQANNINYNNGNAVYNDGSVGGGNYVTTYQGSIFGFFITNANINMIGTSGGSGFDGSGSSSTGDLFSNPGPDLGNLRIDTWGYPGSAPVRLTHKVYGESVLLQTTDDSGNGRSGRSSIRWHVRPEPNGAGGSMYSQVDVQRDGVWIKNADWSGENNGQVRYWHYTTDGKLVFPDNTEQTTAYTGTGSFYDLSNRPQGNTALSDLIGGSSSLDNGKFYMQVSTGVSEWANLPSSYSSLAIGNVQGPITGAGGTKITGMTASFGQAAPYRQVLLSPNQAFMDFFNRGSSIIGWKVYPESNPSAYVTVTEYLNYDLGGPSLGFDTAYLTGTGPWTAESADYSAGTPGPMTIRANNKSWAFDTSGNVTFPDGTIQTTAYTGPTYANANVAAYLTANPQPGTFGNGNVVSLLSNFGSNTLYTTSNVTAGNLQAGSLAVYGANATLGTTNGSAISFNPRVNFNGNIFVTGNVSATNIGNLAAINKDGNASNILYGNGVFAAAPVSGSSYANTNVADYLPTYTGNVAVTNLTSANTTITGNLLVGANNDITLSGVNSVISGANSISASYLLSNVVQGTLSNVTLVAGSYSTVLDNTGNVTFPNGTVNMAGNSTSGVFALDVGVAADFLPNTVASFTSNVNNYTQVTLQNKNTGADATADYIVTADNGSDTVNFLDIGIINSGYDNSTPTNSLGNIVYAADSYVYAQGNASATSQSGGNLAIGTTVAGKTVKFFAGGTSASNVVATIANTGVAITGNLTINGAAVGYGVTTPTIGSNTSPVTGTITATTSGTATTIMTVAIPSAGTWQIVAQVNASLAGGQECVFGLWDGTGTFVTNSETRAGYIGGAASFQGQGSSLWTVTTTGAVNYTVRSWSPGAVANCSITNGADGRTNVSWTLMNTPVTLNGMTVPSNITVTGNVYANNWQGSTPNVYLVAGGYTYSFENNGIATFPGFVKGVELTSTNSVGDEGGQLNLAVPVTNTTLANSVTVDVYQNKLRLFEGSANAKGVSIDLSKAPNGVGGELSWKVSGIVNAGTFVTMDNLKVTVTTSGNRGLSVAAVTGSFVCHISGWYAYTGGSASQAESVTYTTTASASVFGWSFGAAGCTAQYHILDNTNSRFYRITMMIGTSYINNFISIERLH